ncbi:MAG TPA: BamA/TamA family outer membrane protein [Polyangia bacterium]|nr:BamA/TamA family outer membrane protein [Polyangia bacterium]
MRTSLIAAVLVAAASARAEETTPPDVVHGERYDGRDRQRSARPYLLALPRVVLGVPRLLVRGLDAAAKPLLEWNERRHVAERVIGAVTTDDGKIGVRPVIDYVAGYRPSFGVLFFDERLPRDARVTLSAAIGDQHTMQENVHATVPVLESRGTLELDAGYRRRNDELYAGLGMHRLLPEVRYAVDQVDASASLSLRVVERMHLELGFAYGYRRFADGESYGGDPAIGDVYTLDDTVVPGFASGTQFFRETAGVHLDSRRTEMSTGVMVDGVAHYTHGIFGDDSSYLRLHTHLGSQIKIWRHRALYLGVSVDDLVRFGDTPIPFSELATLGGPDDLRGFGRGRFRGASSVLATVEWRWPVWMWMDGTLFFDYGGTFGPGFKDFAVGDLRPDVGIGFRVHTASKYVMRVQVAWGFGGDGGFRLVIAGNGNPS